MIGNLLMHGQIKLTVISKCNAKPGKHPLN